MADIVTEQFHQSLRSSPSGRQKTGTMIDEIYGAMETSENPLDRVIQMITECHGPWSGGSTELFKFASFVASLLNIPAATLVALNAGESACVVERAIAITPPSAVGRQNTQTCATMSTPMLREFITLVQNLHPAVNMYLALHQDTYPYFKPISEEVGSFAHITIRLNETDPSKWGQSSSNNNCLDTPSRLTKHQSQKLIPSIAGLMETSNKLVNAIFVRNMQADNNIAVLRPNYSSEAPIAHGHNFCMDVHNAQRRRAAIGGCLATIMALVGDLLRLLNKFFCIFQLGNYETESFNITISTGANNTNINIVTDPKGRVFSNEPISNTVSDPTNDRMINAKEGGEDEIH
jgi:hypothetical protein